MKETILMILRIILSVLLVTTLVSFISLYSITQNIHQENFKEVVSHIAIGILEKELDKRAGNVEESVGINYEEIHSNIISECEGKELLNFEEINIEVDCNEVRSYLPEDFEESFREKVGEIAEQKIEEELEKQGIDNIEIYFEMIRSGLILLGIVSIILAALIVFFSVPKYKFAVNLGVVGLISGIPFLFAKTLNIAGKYAEIAFLKGLFGSITQSLFMNFLIAFIIGFVLLLVGIVWGLRVKSRQSGKMKKR